MCLDVKLEVLAMQYHQPHRTERTGQVDSVWLQAGYWWNHHRNIPSKLCTFAPMRCTSRGLALLEVGPSGHARDIPMHSALMELQLPCWGMALHLWDIGQLWALAMCRELEFWTCATCCMQCYSKGRNKDWQAWEPCGDIININKYVYIFLYLQVYIFIYIYRDVFWFHTCPMLMFQLESHRRGSWCFRSGLLGCFKADMPLCSGRTRVGLLEMVGVCYDDRYDWRVDFKPLRYCTSSNNFSFRMILLGLSFFAQLSHLFTCWCDQNAEICWNLFATWWPREDDENGDTLKVVDLVSGQEVVELAGHLDHVMCGSISWRSTAATWQLCSLFSSSQSYKCRTMGSELYRTWNDKVSRNWNDMATPTIHVTNAFLSHTYLYLDRWASWAQLQTCTL